MLSFSKIIISNKWVIPPASGRNTASLHILFESLRKALPLFDILPYPGENQTMKNIAVIGGGASGIIAALFASEKNRVILYEKQKKIGRKILVTGNGRCNLTNKNVDISKYHGHNPKFVLNVFSKFNVRDTEAFFNHAGIPLIEEKDGKIFPASGQASTITEILEYELKKKAVEVLLHKRVEKIIPLTQGFKIITAGKEERIFDSVILSAGSCASSHGASTISYDIAESLGHKIFKPFPAILPVNIPLKKLHTLKGIRWRCKADVKLNEKIIDTNTGEILFTEYGISGPAALNISRSVNQNIRSGNYPCIELDFFPELSDAELLQRLENLWQDGEKNLSFSLIGVLKKRMPEVLLQIAGLDEKKQIKNLELKEKQLIIKTFKSLSLKPGKPRSFNDAVIAAGGVDVNEINPSTMESRIIKNLYITGELLDIDGKSGGYNLQFAWSTGAIAGSVQ